MLMASGGVPAQLPFNLSGSKSSSFKVTRVAQRGPAVCRCPIFRRAARGKYLTPSAARTTGLADWRCRATDFASRMTATPPFMWLERTGAACDDSQRTEGAVAAPRTDDCRLG